MGMPKLVKSADDACLGAISGPPLVDGLIGKGIAGSILLGPEEQPVLILFLLEELAQETHQDGVVEKHPPYLTPLADDSHMLVPGFHLQVLNVDGQRLVDTDPRFMKQTEEEPITALGRRNDAQDRLHSLPAQAPRPTRRQVHTVDFEHGIGGHIVTAIGPQEEAG
jgi:hypothetical protein